MLVTEYILIDISLISCSPNCRITDRLWNIPSAFYLYWQQFRAEVIQNISTAESPGRWPPLKETLNCLQNSKNIVSIFILLEVLLGCIGGIIFINKSPEYSSQSLMDSILNFYLILNGIFFGSTIFLGIVSGVVLKKSDRLIISILLSLATGIGFLLLHALVVPLPLFAFFSLFGFIIGFNFYLLKKPSPKNK